MRSPTERIPPDSASDDAVPGLRGRSETSGPANESVPRLRLLWDRVPSFLRRPILWAMRSDRIRLMVLDRLGIRKRSGFITLSPGGVTTIEQAMKTIASQGPVGDYYEFGLYRGYTLWSAQRAADSAGISGMRFFGFDSFSGLPEVGKEDRRSGIFVSGDYACSREDVEHELTSHGFDWSRAALVEGYFDTSLTASIKTRLEMGPAALVMIDCDLYQSTVPVLNFMKDLFQDGTVVLFDDWHCFGGDPGSGEPRALREFLEANPEWRAEWLCDYHAYGRVFTMRLANTAIQVP